MSIYYQDDYVTLYHGDCLEILPQIEAVDLVVTSPPYNKGRQSGDYANMKDGYASYDDSLPDAEYVAWQQAIISELWRITRGSGAIFYNHKPVITGGSAQLPTRLIPKEAVLRQIIIWNRKVGMNWNASFFCPQHEWIMLLAHPDFRLRDRSASVAGDVWTMNPHRGGDGHPCAFPESLPEKAIEPTTARTVLDPFAGSGTTLVAARNLGRKAIGIELDEGYCEIIAKRLSQGAFDFTALEATP